MAKYIKTEQGYIDMPSFAPAQFKPEGKSYLTFSSPKSFTLEVKNKIKNWNGTLEYFSADKTWTIWDGTTILSAYNNDGEYVLYLRGTGNTVITNGVYAGRWVLTGSDIKCIGNIENLLDYTTVEAGNHPTMTNTCYQHMFQGCTSLTQAPALPATTLAESCYSDMFSGCTSLTQAPYLPATTLANNCYSSMFEDCTSLAKLPALPATTLMNNCYSSMFQGCTSLTQAPELPATTLANNCYSSMFYGCTSLTKAPELPATTLANNCYVAMFFDCTSLTQAPELPATTLTSGCYYNMFSGCTSLTQAPYLPATTLANNCYSSMFEDCTSLAKLPALPATTLKDFCYLQMFYGCTSLKLSSIKTGEYTQEYRIPSSGDGVTATNSLDNMFASTGGTFTGTPAINTTYYLSTDNMIVRDTEVATLNGYVGSMIETGAIDKYNGMTPVECVYTRFGSQQTDIIYVEEGTLIPPSSSASDDIKNAWTKLLTTLLNGYAVTGPNSTFKDLIRGIGLLADNGVFGDLLSQLRNKFICYTDIFKQEVGLAIYNSKADKTITVYFNFYKQDKYQQVVYCISNDTFNDYCSFNEPIKKYLNNINATTLTMPQTEMAAAPTKDMHIATKKYVDDSASNPLNITSATVGQIAKITAVDESGVPTAWSPVDMPTGGGERTFEKVVEMTTAEDAAVISISTDKNGNPLSMSEFYVAITTARNSEATANNYFNCNVLPDTVPSYILTDSAIKSLTLFQDVYCYVMHYKVVGGMIFHEYASRARTSSGLNVAKYLENEKNIGIAVDRGETTGFLSPPYAGNGVSKIDSAGKMYCITFSANSTNCIFGAGTRVEVWAR